MAKTLGCLVGAMTAGALFLHWIEPGSAPTDNRYAIQLRAIEVQESVRPDAAAARVRWQGVIIRADGRRDSAAPEPHFRVTNGGELIPGRPWVSQVDASASGLIEVTLDAPKGRNGGLSTQQANTLIALLSELRQGYVFGDGEVRLDERSFATEDRGPALPQTQRLKELLQSAGLSS